MDEFEKNLHAGLWRNLRLEVTDNGTRHGNRRGRLREGGIMTIPVRRNFRRRFNKVSKYTAADGRGTTG